MVSKKPDQIQLPYSSAFCHLDFCPESLDFAFDTQNFLMVSHAGPQKTICNFEDYTQVCAISLVQLEEGLFWWYQES